MKKLLIASAVVFSLTAQAHDVWVASPNKLASGSVLKAELGYGHFPVTAEIVAERTHFFAPMEVISEFGDKTVLEQKGKNFQYQSSKALADGSYWVTATYKPTFWSQNDEGWKQTDLQGLPDATYCEQTQMFAKNFLSVGKEPLSIDAATTRIGQPLEIVPLQDPTKAKAGEPFPVQVFYQDQPLAGATVIATADTIVEKDFDAAEDHREPQGFSGKTDKQGKVNILPLIEGSWKLKVIHKDKFADQKQCQFTANYATMLLPVGTQRAKLKAEEHQHHHH